MSHDYGVPLSVLSLTLTRDNDAAPGTRLPDKHSRLFCGKTLDEWTMLQLWSSKSITYSVFVCETHKHAERLAPMASKYGIELIVRPSEMLHPLDDSGSIPLLWSFRKAMAHRHYTLVTTPFVVCPCRPPGFFDDMAAFYRKTFGNPDFERGSPQVMGAYPLDTMMFSVQNGRGVEIGEPYLNYTAKYRYSVSNHTLMASWWYEGNTILNNSRHELAISPILWDIEPWMDIHIDTEEQWREAEFWFREKILSKGEDCYESYRRGE